jgi:hypothetical protein
VFIVVVYFVIDSVRKLLDTPSYCGENEKEVDKGEMEKMKNLHEMGRRRRY